MSDNGDLYDFFNEVVCVAQASHTRQETARLPLINFIAIIMNQNQQFDNKWLKFDKNHPLVHFLFKS